MRAGLRSLSAQRRRLAVQRARAIGALATQFALACSKSVDPVGAAGPEPALMKEARSQEADPSREPVSGCRSEKSGNAGHPTGAWFGGTHSKLCAALVEVASHDGSDGKTRLVFDAGPDRLQVKHELTGIYRVFSHSERAHAFVVGGQFETGVIVLVERLALIDDRDGSLRWSSYREPFHIASIVASPDGDTLALVAAPDSAEVLPIRLWGYRVSSDTLVRLGPAPAPPPTDWQCDREYTSRWIDLQRNEGYEDMDPGVIAFPSADVLQASYGHDTCKARARIRSTRRWNLNEVPSWRSSTRQRAAKGSEE